MLTLKNLSEAERFVTRQQRLAIEQGEPINVRWDGWDIVFFREAPQAVYSQEGVWSREAEAFGFANRSPLTAGGTWEIDYRNIRRAR